MANKTAIAAAAMVCAAFAACDNDNGSFPEYPINRPNAIVTVRPDGGGGGVTMQLDDSTTIRAVNMAQSPYGDKTVRALLSYRLLTQPGRSRSYDVYVNWMDSVLTKNTSADLGADANSQTYGTDPVEILRQWTVCEDGFLTIHFRTQWAGNGQPHLVSLVPTDSSNPYSLTFYHNAYGAKGGYWGDGIVAFSLASLPDTKGRTVDMTLNWTSFGGRRSATFRYSTLHGAARIEGLSFAEGGLMEKALR